MCAGAPGLAGGRSEARLLPRLLLGVCADPGPQQFVLVAPSSSSEGTAEKREPPWTPDVISTAWAASMVSTGWIPKPSGPSKNTEKEAMDNSCCPVGNNCRSSGLRRGPFVWIPWPKDGLALLLCLFPIRGAADDDAGRGLAPD